MMYTRILKGAKKTEEIAVSITFCSYRFTLWCLAWTLYQHRQLSRMSKLKGICRTKKVELIHPSRLMMTELQHMQERRKPLFERRTWGSLSCLGMSQPCKRTRTISHHKQTRARDSPDEEFQLISCMEKDFTVRSAERAGGMARSEWKQCQDQLE